MLIKQRNPSTGDTHRQVGGCRWAGGRKKGVVGSSDIQQTCQCDNGATSLPAEWSMSVCVYLKQLHSQKSYQQKKTGRSKVAEHLRKGSWAIKNILWMPRPGR